MEKELSIIKNKEIYCEMTERSLLHMGNTARLKAVFAKAKRGEEITVAFIGGSITQGAGAVPIHTECYAARTFQKLQQFLGKDNPLKFVKAGVGGTPSELGLVRYERDVLREGKVSPDIVVVEFAVNDADDETEGACFEGLVQRILFSANKPAVVLLFSVFADDWNLQERLSAIGYRYDLPMVSIKDAVVPQFYKSPEEGGIVSKSQYFYDSLHPANIGHEIMADCLMKLFVKAAKAECKEKEEFPEPVFGWNFEDVRRLDKRTNMDKAWIDMGSFFHTDWELQCVEMDDRQEPVPQFVDNWMHVSGDAPFRMKIRCRLLMLVFKDSSDTMEGCAEIWVDGKMVRRADPHINNWLHCNTVILLNEKEVSEHFIEINMCRQDENKKFTILGFGFSDTEVKNVRKSDNQKKSNLEF